MLQIVKKRRCRHCRSGRENVCAHRELIGGTRPGGFAEWDHEAAEAELARCWLAAFGPAPAADLQWWAGWTKTQTRRALAAIGAAEVDLEDGGPGYLLAGDEEPAPAAEPWAALLPGLDTTPMGWQERSWYRAGEL